jgi:hypothetical protein
VRGSTESSQCSERPKINYQKLNVLLHFMGKTICLFIHTMGRYTLDIFAGDIAIKRHFSSKYFFPVCIENIFLAQF